MQTREDMEIGRMHKCRTQEPSAINIAAFIPRLWMIMILFAVPFFIISFNYFLALESTGPIGAFFADTLMPATNIAYVMLIFILKSRKI
jgi:hypothetical protein